MFIRCDGHVDESMTDELKSSETKIPRKLSKRWGAKYICKIWTGKMLIFDNFETFLLEDDWFWNFTVHRESIIFSYFADEIVLIRLKGFHPSGFRRNVTRFDLKSLLYH